MNGKLTGRVSVRDGDDDAALAWGLAVAVLQRRDSAIAQVDWYVELGIDESQSLQKTTEPEPESEIEKLV